MLALDGVRILITRSRQQGSVLADQLAALGAETILIPTIEIAPPEDSRPMQEAFARINDFDWIIFTSANAIEPFANRVNPVGVCAKIAAIGPATAHALRQRGFPVHLVPAQYVAESLIEALSPYAAGAKILLLRAAVARNELPDALRAAGARVTVAEAYRNVIPRGSVEALRSLFADPGKYPNAITFTSESTVKNLMELLHSAGLTLPNAIVRASIGPVTSAALREQGFPATIEAKESTIPSLVEALVSYFRSRHGA